MNNIKNKKILFLGVGGIGVSALALASKINGANVTGFDGKKTNLTDKLSQNGINLIFDIELIDSNDFDIIVYSSAIPLSNNIIISAKKHNKIVLQRAQFLAILMEEFKNTIAISGTHGKTTTSSILATLLYNLTNDSSFIIGGIVKAVNSNINIQGNNNLVIEADESDASFLHLKPTSTIITNIDLDHMATYGNNYKNLLNSFYKFINQDSITQATFLCIDDKGCNDLLKNYDLTNKNIITYGFSQKSDVQILKYSVKNNYSYFEIKFSNGLKKSFSSKFVGKHNALNICACIAYCYYLGFELDNIKNVLKNIDGVCRRFDEHNININSKNITFIDDYGHHPVEVKCTLEAIFDKYPNKEIIHIFQPHRYSRNKDFFQEWLEILSLSNKLILLPTFSAGEKKIEGFTSLDIANKLNCDFVENFEIAINKIKQSLNDNSIVLIQGAGDVTNLIQMIKNGK